MIPIGLSIAAAAIAVDIADNGSATSLTASKQRNEPSHSTVPVQNYSSSTSDVPTTLYSTATNGSPGPAPTLLQPPSWSPTTNLTPVFFENEPWKRVKLRMRSSGKRVG
jgi:hypothetical protein